ncbi:MAG: GGDEF domain-containing response regulator [Anaerolineaceae bacterium]
MTATKVRAPERRRVLRVLVVDSAIEDVRSVCELLRKNGEFLPHAARSVDEAQALLGEGVFDVALIEYGLWTERDNHLVRFLRERHGDVAVVLLTSGDNERETLPAMKLGAHDFLSKQHLADGSQLEARILGAFEENRQLRRRDTMVRWLEREACTDYLTGLHNRHAFDERLREVCEKARASRSPVTLIVVDLAGTRIVNEAHGHEVGDAMIRRAASGISRCVRGTDFAARIGGDDFGIVLGDADMELGRLISRRIVHEFERLNGDEWAGEIPVTATFGVASGIGCTSHDLFNAADQQLSHHKAIRPITSLFHDREETDGPSVA